MKIMHVLNHISQQIPGKSIVFVTILLLTFINYESTFAQPVPVPAGQVHPGQLTKISEPLIKSLGNSKLAIYQVEDKYYFIPTPTADWEAFAESVDSTCSSSMGNETSSAALRVRYYDEDMLIELAAESGEDIDSSKITVVPFFGLSLFTEINGETLLIESTVDPKTLLEGETIAQTANLNADAEYQLSDSCENLLDIARNKQLDVRLHAIAHQYATTSASAIGSVIASSKLKADIDNNESEIQQSVVSSSGKSSGFGIKLGPVSLGSSKTGFETTTDTKHYRVVNRDWVKSQAYDIATNLDVSIICPAATVCDTDKNIDLLTEFVLGSLSQQKAEINELADGALHLSVGAIKKPIEIVNLSEELKTTLDQLLEKSSATEASIPINGVPITVKKKDEFTLDIDGSSEWKKSGEDWVPTSFDAYVVDTNKFRDDVRISYSKTLLNEALNVSYGPIQYVSNLPAGFISEKYSSRLTALEIDNSQHDNCETAISPPSRLESCFDHVDRIQKASCPAGKFQTATDIVAHRVGSLWSCELKITCCN